MTKKNRKKRRGFWDWLIGEEPSNPDAALSSSQSQVDMTAIPQEQDEKPHVAPEHAIRPCPLCGGTEFRWDWLESGLFGLGKGPSDTRTQKWVKQKTRFGTFVGLRARLCRNCGHVDLFAPDAEE